MHERVIRVRSLANRNQLGGNISDGSSKALYNPFTGPKNHPVYATSSRVWATVGVIVRGQKVQAEIMTMTIIITTYDAFVVVDAAVRGGGTNDDGFY